MTTTLLQFWPAKDTYWILLPALMISAAVAAERVRRRRRAGRGDRVRWHLGELIGLTLVALATAGPLTAVMHERHSVGPVSYYFTDSDNYAVQPDQADLHSLHDVRQAARSPALAADRSELAWAQKVTDESNLDATPLVASVDELFGLDGLSTYSPFLVVMLLMGGLASFSVVRVLTAESTPASTAAATIAGALYGGPLFLELWFDSYQAAILALALLPTLLILGIEAVRHRGTVEATLAGIVVAALLSVYPLFIPALVGTAAVSLIAAAVVRARGGRPWRTEIRPLAKLAAIILLTGLVLDPVATVRDVRYYQEILQNQIPLPRVSFTLPLGHLPGWLGQTTEFWALPNPGDSAKDFVLAGLLPALFALIAAFGMWRRRLGLVLLALGGISAVIAEYSFASRQSCTYCAERNLLALAPLITILVGVGLWALLSAPRRYLRIAGIAAAVIVVGAVGQRGRYELRRFANSADFFEKSARAVLTALPGRAASVLVEGFNSELMVQGSQGQLSQPIAYHLVHERVSGHPSVILASVLGNAGQYLGADQPLFPPGPEFDPNYRYVLTRLPAIRNGRTVIARHGAVALEERTSGLDVIPLAGLATPFERADPSGTAWVQPGVPLKFALVGAQPGRTAWVRLELTLTVPTTIPVQRGVTVRAQTHLITACVPATGSGRARLATLQVSAPSVLGVPLREAYPPPEPFVGIALTSTRAVVGRCRV